MILALGLILGVPVMAGAKREAKPVLARGGVVPRDLLERDRETWYAIYLGNARIGWALRQTGPLTKAGHTFLRSRYVLEMRTKSHGKVKRTRIERRKIFAPKPPYALIRARATTQRGAFRKEIVLERGAGGLHARIHELEETRRVKIPGAPPTFADEVRPTTWLRTPRDVGAAIRYPQLDLSSLRVGSETLRITSVHAEAARRYEAVLVSPAGDEDRIVYDARGTMRSTRMMGLLRVEQQSKADALRIDEAIDALAAGEASVDRALGAAEKIHALVLRARGKRVEAIPGGPGLASTFDATKRLLTLRIGTKYAPPVRATPTEIRRALTESARYPTRHRVVQALARETVAKGKTAAAKVEALVDFVDEFVMESHTVDPLTVLDILAVQKGDCNEHALLFTTLARAAGIPAREVYGLIYKNDETRTFGRHVWNEVVIDGVWVPVDPTWDEIELSAGHIRLGAVGEGPDRRLALAGVRFELIAIETDPPKPLLQGSD